VSHPVFQLPGEDEPDERPPWAERRHPVAGVLGRRVRQRGPLALGFVAPRQQVHVTDDVLVEPLDSLGRLAGQLLLPLAGLLDGLLAGALFDRPGREEDDAQDDGQEG